MKYLRMHNISIHISFYQNQFINECAKKIKAKIPESQSFTVFCEMQKNLHCSSLNPLSLGIKLKSLSHAPQMVKTKVVDHHKKAKLGTFQQNKDETSIRYARERQRYIYRERERQRERKIERERVDGTRQRERE